MRNTANLRQVKNRVLLVKTTCIILYCSELGVYGASSQTTVLRIREPWSLRVRDQRGEHMVVVAHSTTLAARLLVLPTRSILQQLVRSGR